MIELCELILKLAAGVEPKSTAVAPARSEPEIVTAVPPLDGPRLGLTPVTFGPYVKRSAGPVALAPLGVVTVTSTAPVPAGELAVIRLPDTTVKLIALAEPNLTAVAPVKWEPLMSTEVPPTNAPPTGETLETLGGAAPNELAGANAATAIVHATVTAAQISGDRRRRGPSLARRARRSIVSPPLPTCVDVVGCSPSDPSPGSRMTDSRLPSSGREMLDHPGPQYAWIEQAQRPLTAGGTNNPQIATKSGRVASAQLIESD